MSQQQSLVELIEAHLNSDDLQLPVFHPVAAQVQTMIASNDFQVAKAASLISQDQALASQVLKVANSAFFSGLSGVSSIKDAIVRLGQNQIMATVLMATQREQYQSQDRAMQPYLEQLWRHAMACSLGSKWLAGRLGYRRLAHEAFIGGLVHDIGKLFLLKILEDISSSGQHEGRFSEALVLEVLDALHAEKGYLLLKAWRLPDLYCNLVREHHAESYDGGDVLLGIVRLVNEACHKLGVGIVQDDSIVLAATEEAQHLGISEVILAELEITIEDALGLEAQV